MLKIHIFFFIFCLFNPVTKIDATMQKWVGGIGSVKGINYTVTVIANKSSDKIIPVSMGFKSENLKFIILKNNKKLGKDIIFNKGDTLIFKCSYSETAKLENKQKINNNVIYITFKCKDSKREKRIKITELKKLKSLMYP